MQDSYTERAWKRYRKHTLGMIGLSVFILFFFVGTYAPFFASSLPIAIKYDGQWYFPLFRHLFFPGFYTKAIDLFFNLLMFTLPLSLLSFFLFKKHTKLRFLAILILGFVQLILFLFIFNNAVSDPASDKELSIKKKQAFDKHLDQDWNFELAYMNDYKKLLLVLAEYLSEKRQNDLEVYKPAYFAIIKKQQMDSVSSLKKDIEKSFPSIWEQTKQQVEKLKRDYLKILENKKNGPLGEQANIQLKYLTGRERWLRQEKEKISFILMPLFSTFHWEDNAGGNQYLNQIIHWTKLTRINRKDLLSALIFGIRVSLVVGVSAAILSLIIGIPIGGLAGYFGGKFDIVVSRLIEVWEAMPAFFMLLMIVAILQSKSIFLIILVIGFFGWTSISRYIRAEFFKQRNLSYVEACKVIGLSNSRIIFSHILPNAIPPVLTLLPFAVMGAITSEAGLSFLGLGEEGSSSWGVLMDEGRSAFPGESYLLWPPAILLTILLISIALIGDALRDTLDPKLLR
ncbi:ABC transporter permease [Criblamydia sequanensis]|uniref:Oligopeptide transport system permease protein OppC n=1 Tax=Candidatus Criblamydia sequanensis CRIB-18 TaxID=1437425 RepID=A0A090CZI1_9BACT|nr:ABC transporter permease [Criblamydia sequanensis]CDR34316.1 Putative ABC-type oligopeptide transporter, permease subunit [Criblamydia sequanensis CRIB-18]